MFMVHFYHHSHAWKIDSASLILNRILFGDDRRDALDEVNVYVWDGIGVSVC